MLRIGKFAANLGTTPKTIRYYEKIGLLKTPDRTDQGYRMYDADTVNRAKLVFGLRRLGLSIDEVLDLLTDEEEPSLRKRTMALLDSHIRELGVTISVLQGRFDDLSSRHSALLALPRNHPPDCICGALYVPCTCVRDAKSTS
ncbi:MAG: MerR family transcriptional regulator [Rhodospirillaceae bacterium]|jgi:DNA-binding transcriptional MerR regulator|nr:MerR family transcriptional regulator [Rhodospirillales bacterium]MBT3906960.1 MerR family transcriptional regulator [Rhodospirillaceae bacterium]MBT4699685.1 MerR family transcriptional regulator [Rhodospirillaceae bacterium]MBT5034440.1 MerR family transcriptional regulator [Rhodospirillaceae bacterium]MBT6218406.1 MerR family transcriptional regulator [Rhodospirillaceae bacterium]